MRRDVARARPKAQVPSHRLPTGAVFLALADSCGIVEEARNKLDDHEFVAEVRAGAEVGWERGYKAAESRSAGCGEGSQ